MKTVNRTLRWTLSLVLFNLQIGLIFVSRESAMAQDKEHPLLAVLDLQTTGGILKSEALALSDRLRSEMQELKKFDLIERSQMQALLNEQAFSLSDLSEDVAAKAGKLLSAEQIVVGTIGKVGRTYTVDVRLIDVANGRVINSSKQDYSGPTEGLVQVMRNIARIFAGLTPLKISVADNTKWWILGGALAVGGGAAVLLLGKKGGGTTSFSSPPSLP